MEKDDGLKEHVYLACVTRCPEFAKKVEHDPEQP